VSGKKATACRVKLLVLERSLTDGDAVSDIPASPVRTGKDGFFESNVHRLFAFRGEPCSEFIELLGAGLRWRVRFPKPYS